MSAAPKCTDRHWALFLHQVPGKDTQIEDIKAHVAWLRKLYENQKLVLAGPFLDSPSGLVVIRASSPEEAAALAAEDPFVQSGVRHPRLLEWQIACPENSFLLPEE